MIPGHQCLTQEAVFGLLKLERPQTPTMAAPVLRTLQGLDRCEQCWKTIEKVRQQCTRDLMATANPFAALFHTLITRQVRRASHRIALETVRKAPFGIYRLLLEEIADFLPLNCAQDSQKALLLFDLLLDSIKNGSAAWHDLRARASAIQGLLRSRQGSLNGARESLRAAEHHRRRGTGDRELHATILAIEGELLHGDQPGEATARMMRALELADDLPLRKMELLYQLSNLHIYHQEFEEAWRHLLEAEDLADDHERDFLHSTWQRMLIVETALVTQGDEHHRTLYHCMGNYHARCLGLEEMARARNPPLELWKLQTFLPEHQVPQGRLASLCLAWVAGHDITAQDWQGVKLLLAGSSPGRVFFDALYQQLSEIWCRYPDGRLAFDLLDPLIHILDRIRASV